VLLNLSVDNISMAQNPPAPQAQAPQQVPQPPQLPQIVVPNANVFNANVVKQLNDLCMEMRISQVAPHVRQFNGDGHHKFVEWLKDIEKCRVQVGGDDARMRSLAVATLTGPAADFVLRVIEQQPDVTWIQLRHCLRERYSDLADVQYARRSMRNLKQTKSESVQNYGERIMAAAREAYMGQNLNDRTIQGQLVEIFVAGLRESGIMRRVVRQRPDDLDQAVIIAAEEQQAIKSFELNKCHRGEEPMEVDALQEKQGSLEKQIEIMNKQMLTLTECVQKMASPSRGTNVVSPSNVSRNRYTQDGRPICRNCNRAGHMARECRQRGRPIQHPGNAPRLN
jgi:hypothetical protein